MSKTHTVETKYKNPDKYIERLKTEIDSLQMVIADQDEQIDYAESENQKLKTDSYGNFWFSYAHPGSKLGVSLCNGNAKRQLENLKLDTQVICIGSIIDFKRSRKTDENSAHFYIKDVYLRR